MKSARTSKGTRKTPRIFFFLLYNIVLFLPKNFKIFSRLSVSVYRVLHKDSEMGSISAQQEKDKEIYLWEAKHICKELLRAKDVRLL